MSKLKVGDRVLDITNNQKAIIIDTDRRYKNIGNYEYEIQYEDGSKNVWDDVQLRLLEKTWDNLEAGDILKHKDRRYAIVLGTCDNVIFRTDRNNDIENIDNETMNAMSIFSAKKDWTIYRPEQEEIQELTMDEIASKFNIPVTQLKIKK